jgi:3-methyladenine DNA glycosylase AlkD
MGNWESRKAIHKDLRNSADDRTQKSSQRFFKEKVKVHGVKTAVVSSIAWKYWSCLTTW